MTQRYRPNNPNRRVELMNRAIELNLSQPNGPRTQIIKIKVNRKIITRF